MKNKGGAPKGNRNALKDGIYTAQMLTARRALRNEVRRMILQVRATVAQVHLLAAPPKVMVTRINVTPSPPHPNN